MKKDMRVKRIAKSIKVGAVFMATCCFFSYAHSSRLVVDTETLYFSGPQGEVSETASFTIYNYSDETEFSGSYRIVGENESAFRMGEINDSVVKLAPGSSKLVGVVFTPDQGKVGPLIARCEILSQDGSIVRSVSLRGLSAPGMEGAGEAPLAHVIETLGWQIDVGWQVLPNHTRPDLMGDEVVAQAFRKAGPGSVIIRPVARYSPDFLLPFGIYDADSASPELQAVGTLAMASDTRYEQNCLFPRLVSGSVDCEPEFERFGIFTASPSHVAYTQDALNASLEPEHVAHAARVYPFVNEDGIEVENTYLVCFEEASNGDYQDYVFLVSNVVLVN